MGRVVSMTEAQAIAKARNTLTVIAVLTLLLGAFAFGFRWWALSHPDQTALTPADLATAAAQWRADATIMFVFAAVHLVCILGMQRVVTVAWLVPAGFYTLATIGSMFRTLDHASLGNVVTLLLNLWITSRLLDGDVLRAFLRFGEDAPPPGELETEPEWHLQTLPPIPVAQPVTAPPAPIAPLAPPSSSTPYGFFG